MNAANHSLSEQFWEPTRSLTLTAAHKHTSRIKVLRRICILSALGLVGVLIYFIIEGDSGGQMQTNIAQDSVRMTNPRYTGLDGDGVPYNLTADYAVRTLGNPNAVSLKNPILKFSRLEGTKSSNITSLDGIYEHELQILELRNEVVVTTDTGYVCETNHARIRTLDKVVEGDEAIRCDGGFGHVDGGRFEILDNYSRFVFLNSVKARLVRNDDTALQTANVINKDTP